MSHVVFVDNVLLQRRADGFEIDLQPHIGLISLIATLRERGHRGSLYDPKLDVARGELVWGPSFYRQIAERIVALQPDVVGFTSLGCNFACTVQVAAQLRELADDLPIVLGGPHASILDECILRRYPQFDAVVRGEAESTIAGIVETYAARRLPQTIHGVTYRREGALIRNAAGAASLELDALPYPAYDAYPIAELGLTSLRVDAGRGCPFACTFCSTASFFGRRYRLKSADALVERLDRLSATYGIRRFELMHDLFTVDKRKVRAFCEAVAERGYDWTCSARMDCVDDELLSEMREAGCSSIYYGVETGSARLQRVVNKRLDLSLYDRRLAVSLGLGIETTVSFITGYPEETVEDQDATLDLIGRTLGRYRNDCTVQLHLLAPEPGTAMLTSHGATLAYDGHVGEFNLPPLGAGDEALIASDPDVFVCQQYYAAGVPRDRNIDATDGYRLLYALGHGVLAAMTKESGRPFSVLVCDAGRLLRESRLAPPEALAAFVRREFGPDSPFADVVAAIAAGARLRIERRRRTACWRAETTLALAANVVPVGFVRDGFAIAQAFERDDPIEFRALARRPSLLIGSLDLTTKGIFAVDERTLNVAQALVEPIAVDDLHRTFGRDQLQPRLWALAMLGAIVDASSVHEPSIPSLRSMSGSAPSETFGGTKSVDNVAIRARGKLLTDVRTTDARPTA